MRWRRCVPPRRGARWERRSLRAPEGVRITVRLRWESDVRTDKAPVRALGLLTGSGPVIPTHSEIPVSNLRDLAQHQDKSGSGNGLTHLVKAHCPGVYHGEHLDKSGAEVRAIRTGDWGSWPLSPAALAYAALDVLMRWTC